MAETKPAYQPPAVPRSAWNALIVLMAGMFMALLDTTIVNVALPTIHASLDASEATLSWIICGYALAFGIALIPAGRVGDRIGHKWVFFTGLRCSRSRACSAGWRRTARSWSSRGWSRAWRAASSSRRSPR